ncbi:hypothetical protein [Scytonema sp. NUACC26]|uniref:hypothetical protein n=1 Tax=Scytonema sp. NUACC26 TaxID=3140176 RepID=UPI0034DB8363
MIKFSYDSTGILQTIHIRIDDYFAQTPYNPSTRQMDWNFISYEPTRNSIKSIWENWAQDKDLNYELRDRPDLAPPQPKPNPDWKNFNLVAMTNSTYNRIANQTTNQRSVTRFESLLMDYSSNAENPNYLALQILWNSLISGLPQKLTETEISNLNSLCKKYFMRFSIDLNGLFEIEEN